MRRISATLLLMFLICAVAKAQTTTNQPTTNNPPNKNDSTSQDSTSQQSQPPAAPPSADSTTPDGGNVPQQPDKQKSAIKRKLDQLTPHCIDIGAKHTCWSQPKAPKSKKGATVSDDPEYAKDMDVGDFYLHEKKNYKGAELRFRDALEHKPNDPLATFMLAEALEGEGQAEEARDNYATYLKLDPKGTLVAEAQQALDRLQSKTATQGTEKKPQQ